VPARLGAKPATATSRRAVPVTIATAPAMPPRAAPSRRKSSAAEAAMASPESAHYRQMLAVLTQFRVVVANLKKHYHDIETVTGVTGTQLWALVAIAQQPGLTVGQLARELAVHQSTASNLLDKLAELGYVTRAREGVDQRVVSLYLTDTGLAITKSAPQPAMGLLQHALLSLPDERVAGLHEHLEELIRAIGVKRAPGEATPLSVLLHEDQPAGKKKTRPR